jgi:ribosomal protein S18 acetylase RimI-like enzyme
MYQFIPAKEHHLDQIVPLLASTGYWEAALRRNHPGLPVHQFIREYVAKQYLPFTTVVVRNEDQQTALGILTCSSKQEIESTIVDYSKEVPVEISKLFAKFEIPDSYHISFLALDKTCRGQGIGASLMSLAEDKWKQSKLETLSLYTFSCQTSALKLYLKAGMMITHVFNVSDKLPCPCALYLEKNLRTASLQNYFETPAYQNFSL